ncbi:MAG: 16S rRNA (cytosine(1402)-N(4))-methyltransferase [Spirochaetae bacterium HGW-Spirochaetae-3]|jgi:16S rRNA (cytosine1402-N4)-methyltransferase|nr:MAG: 16S rRNA (cytosine(1402)-N(4))-methyltransferase [Spirochaetae bacterium HGW-Spirochaetae-3]
MEDEPIGPHKRRVRYKGTHPRSFSEKYKELDSERYPGEIEKVKARGATPAGDHLSICVGEVLEILDPRPGESVVDATLGHGGHSAELLKAISPGGRLYGLDRDPVEIAKTEARLRAAGYGPESFVAVRMNFSELGSLFPIGGIDGVDMLLADLGVSSMQIDDPERGFTFKHDGPLDMRMDPDGGRSAAELLLDIPEAALRELIDEYSDEPEARVIARVLTQRRGTIDTTAALRNAVRYAVEDRVGSEDLTRKAIRRTFQALRIAVNGELDALDSLLAALPRCLNPGGRAAILCFHSGEESRVERSFREGVASGAYGSMSSEAVRASPGERRDNPRSSSARLLWARKSLGDR